MSATAVAEDNSYAGQGSVLLDIGGEIGALVLHAPAELEGVEIEIRPTGNTPFADGHARGDHQHVHEHPSDGGRDGRHHDGHGHDHDGHDHEAHGHDGHDHEAHGHEHGDLSWSGGVLDGHRLLHVAVLRRPVPNGIAYAAVYPQLHEGTYELYRRPAEPVALAVSITGAHVTEARWPAGR